MIYEDADSGKWTEHLLSSLNVPGAMIGASACFILPQICEVSINTNILQMRN